MLKVINTSEANRAIIINLTNKLGLGTENVIARLAYSFSLSKGERLDLKDIRDSKGKSYPAKILFGSYTEIYIAMLCELYEITMNDIDIPKYVKMHLDHGLEEMAPYANNDGMDFVIRCVEEGLRLNEDS